MLRKIFRTKKQNFVEIECISFKQQLESLEGGVDTLDDRRNTEYQIKSPDDYTEDALASPMGLLFVSRLEAGHDFHNPVFSDVRARLGLDINFNKISSED